MDAAQIELVNNEVKITNGLDHKNILYYYEHYENDTHLFIVNEQFNGVPLFKQLTKPKYFLEKDIAYIIKQIC